jgi:hypothetical protein
MNVNATPVTRPELHNWRRARPEDATRWLESARAPWWIAGGWALELFCTEAAREHADVDVGCFRDDLGEIRSALGPWDLYEAHEGRLTLLGQNRTPRPEVHSLWCKPEAASQWWLELLLDERADEHWVFRRATEIRLPAHEIVRRDALGTPYLRPELQLLYKAKARRLQDETDFQNVLPQLDHRARRWLRDALGRCDPDHPWLTKLDG